MGKRLFVTHSRSYIEWQKPRPVNTAQSAWLTTRFALKSINHRKLFQMEKPDLEPRFGWLLLACLFVAVFCGFMVWFASTYLTDCCGP